MLDEIFFLGAGADAAFAAAGLMAIRFGGGALDVAGMAHGDEHVGVGDEVFELDLVDLVHDLRAAIVAVGFVNFAQFPGDDLLEFLVAGENLFQFRDQVANRLQFLENFVDGELREAVQLQFEDGVDLRVAEVEGTGASGGFDFGGADETILAAVELHAFELLGLAVLGDGDVLLAEILEQVFLGFGAAGGTTNDADDVVEVVESDLVADQNVFALFRFAQFEDGATANHFHAVFNEELDERDEAEFARLAGDDGQQDHAEGFLHLGVLEEIVEDELRFLAALQLDDDAHAFARRFVAHIGNAFDFLGLHEFRDALDQSGLVDLVGNFGDDDIFAILGGFFDGGFGAHDEAAASGLVGGFDAFAAGDVGAGREIRAGHDLHHFLERSVWLFDQENGGFHNLAKVVRRNVGGHADGDAAGAVHEEIGNARRENNRLFTGLIEVGDEIDRFFFKIRENVFGDLGEARFGVPHGRRWIAVDGTEIPLAIDERVTHVEVLRQANKRGVDDCFTVRVIIAGSVAADLGALAVAAIGGEAQIVHGDEDAALDGLEAVANVGKRARDDDAHRVVEIRLAHFGFDIDGKQYGCVLFVCHVSSFVRDS